MAGFDPNQPRDEQGRWTSNGNAVPVVAALTIALSALAGGAAGATSVSASVDAYGTRISRSEADARTGRSDAQTSGTDQVVKITRRLKGQGHNVKVQAEPKQTDCDAHSDGDVRTFFIAHPCQSLYRQLIEIETKKNVILLGMATIQMDDPQTATNLKTLLDQTDRGKIIQLSRDSGKFRHFSFTNSLATTTQYGPTVTTYDGQVVSGDATNFILIAFLNNALFGVGDP